jgi:hypothetical protein
MALLNTNTALFTDTSDKTGCSSKVGMNQVHKGGRRRRRRRRSSKKQRGGSRGYGVTFKSLQNDANSGQGYLLPTRVNYSNCGLPQTGGHKNLGLGHVSLAETRFNNESTPSYGYSKVGAEEAHQFRGGYPSFTKNPGSQQCGGRRRRKSKRKSKRKARRKSKRKARRKSKRKSRRKSKKCKNCGTCHKGKCKKVGKKCKCVTRKRKYRRRKRKTQRGGSSVFYSGVDSSIDHSTARLLKSDYRSNVDNCGDNYNHFNKSKDDTPKLY